MVIITEFRIDDSNFYVKNGMVVTYDDNGDEVELCESSKFIEAAIKLQNFLDFIELNGDEVELEE